MKLQKTNAFLNKNDDGKVQAVWVEGYSFETGGITLFVHKTLHDGKLWNVSDPASGLRVTGGFPTRKKALEAVDDKMAEKMAQYMGRYEYRAQVRAARTLRDRGSAMGKAEFAKMLKGYEKEEWAKVEAANKAGADVKVTAGGDEPSRTLDLKGKHVCITGVLPGMTRDMAFARLKEIGGYPSEKFTKKTDVFVAANNRKSVKRKAADKAIAEGRKLAMVSGEDFVEALKRGASVEETKVKVTTARITPTPEGVKAEVIEEHEETVKAPKAPKPKKTAEKPAEKPTPKAEETAFAVTLDTMKAWCDKHADKREMRAELHGKNEDMSLNRLWVYGVKRNDEELKDELKELGFHFGKSKRYGAGWWTVPAA